MAGRGEPPSLPRPLPRPSRPCPGSASGRRAGRVRRTCVRRRPVRARRGVGRPDDPEGVVLWTRLAPRPLEPGGGMPAETVEVRWEVARDEAMKDVVRTRDAPSRPRSSATRSTSRSTASSRTAGTGIGSAPATRPARSAAPGPCRPTARRRPAPVRLRLVPALRAGSLHRLRAHGQGRPRPGVPPGRLHLRIRRARQARPQARTGRRSESLDDYRIRHAQYRSRPAPPGDARPTAPGW